MSDMKREPVRELVEFRVDEVSLVDSPAIEEEFAIVKRDSGVILKATASIPAPAGHHWMDYKGGPVLMAGDDIDHAGASASFDFEIVAEHDPDRMKDKYSEPMGDEDKYHTDDPKDHEMKSDDGVSKASTSAHEALAIERMQAVRNLASGLTKTDDVEVLKETAMKINSLIYKLSQDAGIIEAISKNTGAEAMTEQNVDQDKNAEEVEASVEKKTEDTVDEVAKGGHEEEEKGGHDEDEEEEE